MSALSGALRFALGDADWRGFFLEGQLFFAAVLDRGERVYLHCRAGIGRTGTVAGCLLVEHGFTGAEALALLQRKWLAVDRAAREPRTPETDAQRAFVAGWQASRR